MSSAITHRNAYQALLDADAIFFDFDEVILDSEWPIFQSWKNLFTREGHTLQQTTYVQCIGSDFNTWSPQQHLEDLTGKKFNWEKENAARQLEITRDLEFSTAMPGVEALVSALSEKPTAVVSSSSHGWVDGWLEKLQLASYFDTTICRGDAPRIKPAPDLFLEAAKQCNTPPKDCLVIEDSVNGMLAAKKAGMRVLAVPTRLTNILDFSKADWTVSSLAELTKFLNNLK